MDKRSRRFDKLHITSESAIVPPIGHQCRHGVAPAFIINFDDEEIAGVANETGDFEVERREAAFMLPDLLAVEINVSLVVRRSKINEESRVWPALVIKRFFVPDGAFVKEQPV